MTALDLPLGTLDPNTQRLAHHVRYATDFPDAGTEGNVLVSQGPDTPAQWLPQGDAPPNAHVLATTSGLGPEHTTTGLTAGQVLRATAATAAVFMRLAAGDIDPGTFPTGNFTFGGNTTFQGDVTVGAAPAGAEVLRAASARIGSGLVVEAGTTAVQALTATTVTASQFIQANNPEGALIVPDASSGSERYWQYRREASLFGHTEVYRWRLTGPASANKPVMMWTWFDSSPPVIVLDPRNSSGRSSVLIGTASASTGDPVLDVVGGTFDAGATIVGAHSTADGRKSFTIGLRGRLASHKPQHMISADQGVLSIGGGVADVAASQIIRFFTTQFENVAPGTLAADLTGVGASSLFRFVGDAKVEQALLFGAAGDTNLYRDAANSLKTDDDFSIGTLGRFDGSDAPTDLQLLVYHAGSINKWQAESIQFVFNAGDTAAGLLADNTSVLFLLDDPGTGADSPVGAPPAPADVVATALHKAVTLEIRSPNEPADFRYYEWEKSTDNVNWSALTNSTSVNVTHGRLTPGTTYYYRVRAVDRAGNASAFVNASPFPITAEANSKLAAFGAITATMAAFDSMAALSANIGIATTGQIRGPGNTSGINFSGVGGIPAGWVSGINFENTSLGSMTQYLNFHSSAGVSFFKHDKFDLRHNGDAFFFGKVDVGSGAVVIDPANPFIALGSGITTWNFGPNGVVNNAPDDPGGPSPPPGPVTADLVIAPDTNNALILPVTRVPKINSDTASFRSFRADLEQTAAGSNIYEAGFFHATATHASGTVANLYGLRSRAGKDTTNAVTTMAALVAEIDSAEARDVTNLVGLLVNDLSGGLGFNPTTAYGIKIDEIAFGTTKWAIFCENDVKLAVGDLRLDAGAAYVHFSSGDTGFIELENRGNSNPSTPSSQFGRLYLRNTGSGTAIRLSVIWSDGAEDILASGPLSDYVFEHAYVGEIRTPSVRPYGGLLPLPEVEAYTRKHFHLPGTRGGRFDIAVAAEKIEESFLYHFDHEREITRLRTRVSELEAELAVLRT